MERALPSCSARIMAVLLGASTHTEGLTGPACIQVLHIDISSTVGVSADQHSSPGHVSGHHCYTLTESASLATAKRTQHKRGDLRRGWQVGRAGPSSSGQETGQVDSPSDS